MRTYLLAGALTSLIVLVLYAGTQMPAIAAGGLLFPSRTHPTQPRPAACVDAAFEGVGVTLRAWRCAASGPRRGTVVYLHGVADNRGSRAGVLEHFTRRGFDVIAYDSRAHGDSGGEVCTYGYFEKQDLRLVLDTIGQPRVLLFGNSLGAAVALQTAAEETRVIGVVAIESFSDLRTIARERAFFLPRHVIDAAFRRAEERGRFVADRVSPVEAAAQIRVPVLLIHGKSDDATLPSHSERIYAALAGPKRLLLVDEAGHNASLGQPGIWTAIDTWIDGLIGRE